MRLMSGGISMEASSTFEKLIIAKRSKRDAASSSTRIQAAVSLPILGLMPMLDSAREISEFIRHVISGFDQLRQSMSSEIDKVDKNALYEHETLSKKTVEMRIEKKAMRGQRTE